MLSINEVNREIEMLEKCDTSYYVCEKLAYLYIVRDHYEESRDNESDDSDVKIYSKDFSSGTEFEYYASMMDRDTLIKVLSEPMERMGVLFPDGYTEIMEKMKRFIR